MDSIPVIHTLPVKVTKHKPIVLSWLVFVVLSGPLVTLVSSALFWAMLGFRSVSPILMDHAKTCYVYIYVDISFHYIGVYLIYLELPRFSWGGGAKTFLLY